MMSSEVAPYQHSARAEAARQELTMAEDRLGGAVQGVPRPLHDAAPRSVSRLDGVIHYLLNDGRRFPVCGSWRSNWGHTHNPERATCPYCRETLTHPPPSSDSHEEE